MNKYTDKLQSTWDEMNTPNNQNPQIGSGQDLTIPPTVVKLTSPNNQEPGPNVYRGKYVCGLCGKEDLRLGEPHECQPDITPIDKTYEHLIDKRVHSGWKGGGMVWVEDNPVDKPDQDLPHLYSMNEEGEFVPADSLVNQAIQEATQRVLSDYKREHGITD